MLEQPNENLVDPPEIIRERREQEDMAREEQRR